MDWNRQLDVTPNGSQTLSKREAAFLRPYYPRFASSGQGPYLYAEGHRYIDLNGALGAVTIGYGKEEIFRGEQMELASLSPVLSLPSLVEGEASSIFVDRCDWVDSVRFVKTGSEANEAAIRIARIATGRKKIMTFAGHYHGWHSQEQAPSTYSEGIPCGIKEGIALFSWPSTEHIRAELQVWLETRTFAAVLLEPIQLSWTSQREQELKWLREVCTATETILIFDEILSGFRYAMFGASELSGIHPDLATYGKCLAQGLPLACVVGGYSLMKHAWVVSGTFGGDRLALTAFCNVVKFYDEFSVVDELWDIGKEMKRSLCDFLIYQPHQFRFEGSGPRLKISFLDDPMNRQWYSFLVGCLRNGIFMHPAGINVMFAHEKILLELGERLHLVANFMSNGGLSDAEFIKCQGPEPAWRDR